MLQQFFLRIDQELLFSRKSCIDEHGQQHRHMKQLKQLHAFRRKKPVILQRTANVLPRQSFHDDFPAVKPSDLAPAGQNDLHTIQGRQFLHLSLQRRRIPGRLIPAVQKQYEHRPLPPFRAKGPG